MRNAIKKFIKKKRWSVKCDRVERYLSHYNVKLEDCSLRESSDFHWGERKNRTEKDIINIGAISYGGSYNYLFIYHN